MSPEVPVRILDSFALLAFFDGEVGADLVQQTLTRCDQGDCVAYLPMINFGEILYIVERNRGLPRAQKVQGVIDRLPLILLEATRERVLAAAHVKARFRLSYADAFVVAAAKELNGTVLTGDPEFSTVTTLIKVIWLPRKK